MPNAPLYRFSIDVPRIGWAFMDTYHGLPQWGQHGWTTGYLILWDGSAHDEEWFAEHRGKMVVGYDDWQGPHYGEGVVLHEIHAGPSNLPEERTQSEAATIRLALQNLRDPIPSGGICPWRSIQWRESIDAGVFIHYQALFLERGEGDDQDLIRTATFTRCYEDRFHPPERIRLSDLDLEGAGGWDSCLEVTVPRQRFREAYHQAIGWP